MPTIGSYYAHAATRGAIEKGLELDALLQHTSINPTLLADPKSRINTFQMSRLIKNIWRLLEDEFMGFTPNPCPNGVFALMTEYAKQAANLRGLLQRGIHFYNLFTRDIRMNLEIPRNSAEHTVYFVSPEYDPDGFYAEFWMVVWHRFSSWYIGESIPLQEAHFTCAQPAHLEEMRFAFPCRLLFEQPDNRLVFNASYLDKPLIRSEAELSEFLRHSPEDLMTVPGEDKSLAGQIKKLLVAGQYMALPDLSSIAQAFSVTPQTVNNHLKKEGTHYQRIKDEVRRDIAIDQLVSDRLSVEQIAENLGFQEARSFSRAFKKWTGLSPTRYRFSND